MAVAKEDSFAHAHGGLELPVERTFILYKAGIVNICSYCALEP